MERVINPGTRFAHVGVPSITLIVWLDFLITLNGPPSNDNPKEGESAHITLPSTAVAHMDE